MDTIVKQTGLLFKFTEKDFIAGSNSPIVGVEVKPDGDWRSNLPVGEPQYSTAGFDTMSCTTFSAYNDIETWCNFLLASGKLSTSQTEKCKTLGLLKDGKFNFSDRFTAIMSGTTQQGNYFQAVLDSIRNDGAIAESDLPFGGNNWAEYHDKTKITQDMKNKAKKFTEVFKVSYEWTPVDDTLAGALKQCPVQIAIPVAATHAVMLPKIDYIFDSYPPYLYQRNTPIGYAMKIIVEVVPEPVPVVVPPVDNTPSVPFYKPANFSLKELVSPEIYTKFGEKAWQFFDVRALKNLQFLRETFGPTFVNVLPGLTHRGFDACEFRKDGTSQHNMGRAFDCTFKNYTSQQVKDWLKNPENAKKLPEPNIWVENETTWFHFDVRLSDKTGVYYFNP